MKGDSYENDVLGPKNAGIAGGLLRRKDFDDVESNYYETADIANEYEKADLILSSLQSKEVEEKIINYLKRKKT